MAYRTRTYIAADWDGDHDAVEQLHKWNDSNYWSLSFPDAHELEQSRDTSKACSIKKSLKDRMDHSNRFVLIVGDHTKALTKGKCWLCPSYDSRAHYCHRGHSVDNRSFIEFECEEAVRADIKVVVLYNDTEADKSKCPEILRDLGRHVAMVSYKDGNFYWDYQKVKQVLE
jgi:hypothetical protein